MSEVEQKTEQKTEQENNVEVVIDGVNASDEQEINVVVNIEQNTNVEQETKQEVEEVPEENRIGRSESVVTDRDIRLKSQADIRITRIHVKNLTDNIEKVLDGEPLSKSNILLVTYSCISLTKKFVGPNKVKLPGAIKKEILLTALETFIDNDEELDANDRQLLKLMVRDVVSSAVDLFCDIDKKQVVCCSLQ